LGEVSVHEARFERSVYQLEDLPQGQTPEIAFVGRSNVGKSSLLNAVLERKNIAKTSKTPGRTQSLNFFSIIYSISDGLKKEATVVDLPGYGYAKVSGAERKRWTTQMEQYLLNREQLAAVVLLLDSRRQIQDEEKWFLEFGREGNLFLALTKTDKLSRSETDKKLKKILQQTALPKEEVFLTSVLKGKVRGIADLRNAVLQSIANT